MTKKILCLFLTLVMIFGALAVLGSCGGDGGSDVCEHVDANKDNKCDECGEKMGADAGKFFHSSNDRLFWIRGTICFIDNKFNH